MRYDQQREMKRVSRYADEVAGTVERTDDFSLQPLLLLASRRRHAGGSSTSSAEKSEKSNCAEPQDLPNTSDARKSVEFSSPTLGQSTVTGLPELSASSNNVKAGFHTSTTVSDVHQNPVQIICGHGGPDWDPTCPSPPLSCRSRHLDANMTAECFSPSSLIYYTDCSDPTVASIVIRPQDMHETSNGKKNGPQPFEENAISRPEGRSECSDYTRRGNWLGEQSAGCVRRTSWPSGSMSRHDQTSFPRFGNGLSTKRWSFDASARLVDTFDGTSYNIADEVLVQQHGFRYPQNDQEPPTHSSLRVTFGVAPCVTLSNNEKSFDHFRLKNTDASEGVKRQPQRIRRTSTLAQSSTVVPCEIHSPLWQLGLGEQSGSEAVPSDFCIGRHIESKACTCNIDTAAANETPKPATSCSESSHAGKDSKKMSLYKTELCRSFEETGSCRYGPKCQFAHGTEELRSVERHPKHKSVMCKTFWEKGSCPYGQRCCFIHTVVPSEKGAISIQSRAVQGSVANSGADSPRSGSLRFGKPAASLANLYRVEDDAVNATINASVIGTKMSDSKSATSVVWSQKTENLQQNTRLVQESSVLHKQNKKQPEDTSNVPAASVTTFLPLPDGISSVQEPLQQQVRQARPSRFAEGGVRRLPIFQSMEM